MLTDDARELLARYAPSDAREAAFVARMRVLLDAPAPFSRASFDPGHFTASAFVLSPERDAVLLIFHKKLGLWLQPGGHIEEADATIAGAALREVSEEVGVNDAAEPVEGLFDVDVHPIPARRDEPAHEHFDLRTLLVAGTREFAASDEVAGARWVPLHEVASVTRDESVQRAVRKLGRVPSLR
jgi:8-oxo-dGTP pyrophosphatase MutT (NUDIX family)